MPKRHIFCALAIAAASPVLAQTRVGPERGAVMVVGGGSIGQDIYGKFIELAGGPDALIIDVPTAGGNATYGTETGASRALRAAGARNVRVLHTIDRAVADADSFVEPIKRAGGVWFEGGRQWHLVDRYAGTKTEMEFRNVLTRGGIVGGTSAGASILSSFLLRGAREGNEIIVAPQYLVGFGYLRDVAIDQHVVARGRLRDLADSLLPRYPNLLGISEDEGTAWLVQKDHAEIIGRNKAFVYGGKENDPGRPFLTLRPGDRYDLASRQVVSRALDASPLTESFVDGLFTPAARDGARATVLVAQGGKVLVSKSYGVIEDSVGEGPSGRYATYMPTTTVPQFDLGNISLAFHSLVAQNLMREGKMSPEEVIPGSSGQAVAAFAGGHGTRVDMKLFADLVAKQGGRAFSAYVSTRIFGPIGARRTTVNGDGVFQSNVDELYRLELGLQQSGVFLSDSAKIRGGPPALDVAFGWIGDTFHGMNRVSQFVNAGGKRGGFVRFADQQTTIIICLLILLQSWLAAIFVRNLVRGIRTQDSLPHLRQTVGPW